MLQPFPAWHVPDEWAAIEATLRPAIERDPQRDSWRVLDQAMSCDLDFWRIDGQLTGWAVTQTLRPVFWVIYVGGCGGSIQQARDDMRLLEDEARKARCSIVKFRGRDWRRVFPNYHAKRLEDGRWEFRRTIQ